tara:strand:- start:751 stop:1125 length:375 start_codon:yes stop_codon:yes gene_type:complete
MSIEHQDWTPVVFKKKQSTTLTNEDIRRSNYNTKGRVATNSVNNISGQKLNKLANETESFEIKKISLSLSKQIQRARLSNKLTQKELALRINVSSKVINEFEAGTAKPDNNVKMKIQRALGVKL